MRCPDGIPDKNRQKPRVAAVSDTEPKRLQKAQKQKAVVEELSSDSNSESDLGNK